MVAPAIIHGRTLSKVLYIMLICLNLHTMMNPNFRDILKVRLVDCNGNCIEIRIRVSLVQFFVKVHNEKVEFSKSA